MCVKLFFFAFGGGRGNFLVFAKCTTPSPHLKIQIVIVLRGLPGAGKSHLAKVFKVHNITHCTYVHVCTYIRTIYVMYIRSNYCMHELVTLSYMYTYVDEKCMH